MSCFSLCIEKILNLLGDTKDIGNGTKTWKKSIEIRIEFSAQSHFDEKSKSKNGKENYP